MNLGRLAAVSIATALALALAGCTGSIPSAVRPTGTFGPDPTPSATPAAPELTPGQVVGTGKFVSPGGDIAGDVSVKVDANGDFLVDLSGFRASDPASLDLRTSPVPLASDAKCFDSETWFLSLGSLTSGADQSLPIDPGNGLIQGDPSFIDALALVRAGGAPGCATPVAAVAQLTWTMPDVHPALKVTDIGPITGAEGPVTLADGVPVAYTVVANDVSSLIAERFSITRKDLVFLNPTQQYTPNDPSIFVGHVLNLSKENR